MSKSNRKSVRKSSKAKVRRARLNLTETAKIKVVGENPFRDTGRFYRGLEMLGRARTVGNFRKTFRSKKSETAGQVLRVGVRTGYVKIAA